MKKLDRIEDLVNRVIIKLKHSCVSFLILAWKSVIPLKLQNKLGHIYDRLEKKQSELKQKLVQTSSKVKKDLSTRTKNIVHKAQDKKKLSIGYPD